MHNLEVLAVVPCTLSYDHLHLLAHAVPLQDARTLVGIFCHWLERGLEGLWFLRAFAPYVQLSLHKDSLRP